MYGACLSKLAKQLLSDPAARSQLAKVLSQSSDERELITHKGKTYRLVTSADNVERNQPKYEKSKNTAKKCF